MMSFKEENQHEGWDKKSWGRGKGVALFYEASRRTSICKMTLEDNEGVSQEVSR